MKPKANKRFKGQAFGLDAIPSAVIALGIAVFALALILTFLGNFQNAQCPTGSTWDTFNATSEAGVDPNTNSLTGCCETVGENNNCTAWWSSFEYNATGSGMEGIAEFNNWWVILVIGVIFLILFAFLATFRRQTASV